VLAADIRVVISRSGAILAVAGRAGLGLRRRRTHLSPARVGRRGRRKPGRKIGAIFGGGIQDALPWGYYAKVLVVSGLLALAVWFGVDLLPVRAGVRLVVGMAAYVLVFVPLALALRLMHREDLHYLWQWLTLRMLKP